MLVVACLLKQGQFMAVFNFEVAGVITFMTDLNENKWDQKIMLIGVKVH